MSYRCLLIGCGNIGGIYDLFSDKVLTWAKAFNRDHEFVFEVYDEDAEKSREIAKRYDVVALDTLDENELKNRDLVVIATPTISHAFLLERALAARPGLVVVEKPVAANQLQIDQLEASYLKAGVRVLVNFHRRFQPGFAEVGAAVRRAELTERCTSILVKYQRGFHNNASHAIDLLEFLFGRVMELDTAVVRQSVEDEMPGDPTVSLAMSWGNTQVDIVGLPWLKASHFEIEIYFETHAIIVCNGGDTIRYLSTRPSQSGHYPLFFIEREVFGLNADYMINVLEHVKKMLRNKETKDNFSSAADISRRILKLQLG